MAGFVSSNAWLRIIKYVDHGHINTSNGTLQDQWIDTGKL